MYTFLLALLLALPLHAVKVDSTIRTFEQRQNKHRIDVYDFDGDYPHLENIDVDARRKKCVEFNLTGSYPVLEHIVYEGGFGTLQGKLTGSFPVLEQVEFLCGNAAMHFDLQGIWSRSCAFTIRGGKEAIRLSLPENVGIIAHVHSKLGATVEPGPLKKQGWWHITQRTYMNELAETADVVLTFYFDIADGRVIFEP